MIHHALRTAVAILIACPTVAYAGDILGRWSRGDGVAHATIAPCGNNFCMTNTWIKPGVTDEKVGEKVVFKVKPQGDGVLKGTGFDPQRDMRFSVLIKVRGNRMTTSGCAVGGLICKSQNWTRD